MLGCLIVTLVLIAVIIVLQKTLPDGSKSNFHPSWRRNVDHIPLAPRDTSFMEERGHALNGRSASPTPSPQIPAARAVARTSASISSAIVTSTLSPTFIELAFPTALPEVARLFPSIKIPTCFTSTVSCTTYNQIVKLGKRQLETDCYTSLIYAPCATTPL
jgi:hypothetical protein